MSSYSSVGIATIYGLDGPRIESRWEGEFFQIGPGPTLYNGNLVSFMGEKRPGRGVDHPPPSSADVKERVELCLYPFSEPSGPVIG